jgi:hypothetical protein
VTLSWDPGLDTHRITGYRISWDTDSGAASAYAFNSTANPGQVSFSGTTATVSGLAPGTVYYFTVTALSNFTDPSSGVVTTYESLLYPAQVRGDPGYEYPIEVRAATNGSGCTPTAEVTNLRLQNLGGGDIRFSWNAVSDPCASGYRVLRANSPVSAAGFLPPSSYLVADTGPATTNVAANPDPVNPYQTKFFLVVARGGAGSTGPWGHYGQ